MGHQFLHPFLSRNKPRCSIFLFYIPIKLKFFPVGFFVWIDGFELLVLFVVAVVVVEAVVVVLVVVVEHFVVCGPIVEKQFVISLLSMLPIWHVLPWEYTGVTDSSSSNDSSADLKRLNMFELITIVFWFYTKRTKDSSEKNVQHQNRTKWFKQTSQPSNTTIM